MDSNRIKEIQAGTAYPESRSVKLALEQVWHESIFEEKKSGKKVFLGGTCNGSTWRDELIPFLEANKIDYFNPVVEDWTPDCQAEEYRQKDLCDTHLYVITADMTGVFSIAEAVDSAHLRDKACLFQVISDGFSKGQYKSLMATAELIIKRGGWAYFGDTFDGIIIALKNNQ